MSSSLYHNPFSNMKFPFLVTLCFLDLSWLKNDPIFHNPSWLSILAKIPFDIPKFCGKLREDPLMHILTYHIWHSSKYLMDNSIQSHIVQTNLIESVAKWYLELKGSSYNIFDALAMTLLMHLQFPISYETKIDILTSLHKDTFTYIYDHIHEWR
jgi:hypothetical protein